MTPEAAQTVALQALAFVAADEDKMLAFAGKTGAGVADLKEGVNDLEFLGGVLDFLLEDEASLLTFCETLDLPPETPMRARAALPGAAVEW